MNKWLEKYNEITYRSRWASVCIGVLLWLILLLEFAQLIRWIIIAESDFSRIVVANWDQLFLIFSLCLMTLRVFALLGNRPRLARVSWNSVLGIFIVSSIYFHLDNIGYFKQPFNCTPSETEICFEVYDMRVFPFWPFATFVYLSMGTFGIVAKSIYTTFNYIGMRRGIAEVDHI